MSLKNKFLPFVVLFFLSLLTFYRLLKPGLWSSQDDMHLFRLQQFHQCLVDGQIPCRFIRDGGFGYGYPLFNYYSPLVYIIAEIFHLFGLSLVNSLKLTFIFSNFLAPLGMYLLVAKIWGKSAGLLSATLFLFAPYRAVDFYVRGALAEFTALNLLPLFFWSYLQSNPYLTIFISAIFLLSHNLYPILTVPLLILWLAHQKKLKKILLFLFSFMLSSFSLLPSLLEKNLVTVSSMTQAYFDYRAHFVTLKQLFFDRSWGFGASLWGPKDDMSFQIGLIHYLLPAILLLLLFIRRLHQRLSLLVFFSFFLAFFLIFLTHNRSTFIWQLFPPLSYLQFPWRLLGFVVFLLSLISGPLLNLNFSGFKKHISLFIFMVATTTLNFSYFKEDIWYPQNNDSYYLRSEEIIRQSAAGLQDYWPKSGATYPRQPAPDKPYSNQKIKIISYTKTSNSQIAEIETDQTEAIITFPLVYFPNWSASLDHQPIKIKIEPTLGLIQIPITSGYHHLYLEFHPTPIRTFANLLSVFSLLLLLIKWRQSKK